MSNFWRDVAERVTWTFLQAFLGTVTAIPLADLFADGVDLERAETLLLAGLAAGASAVFSLLKGIAASRLEELGTAQLIPGSGTYSYESDAPSPDERPLD